MKSTIKITVKDDQALFSLLKKKLIKLLSDEEVTEDRDTLYLNARRDAVDEYTESLMSEGVL